jgi:hypothetical protein
MLIEIIDHSAPAEVYIESDLLEQPVLPEQTCISLRDRIAARSRRASVVDAPRVGLPLKIIEKRPIPLSEPRLPSA